MRTPDPRPTRRDRALADYALLMRSLYALRGADDRVVATPTQPSPFTYAGGHWPNLDGAR